MIDSFFIQNGIDSRQLIKQAIFLVSSRDLGSQAESTLISVDLQSPCNYCHRKVKNTKDRLDKHHINIFLIIKGNWNTVLPRETLTIVHYSI